MKTLTQLFNDVESEKGDFDTKTASWYGKGTAGYWTQPSLGYSKTYEKWFDDIRYKINSFVEFGICDPRNPGNSLKVWHDYFVNAKITGLDNGSVVNIITNILVLEAAICILVRVIYKFPCCRLHWSEDVIGNGDVRNIIQTMQRIIIIDERSTACSCYREQ